MACRMTSGSGDMNSAFTIGENLKELMGNSTNMDGELKLLMKEMMFILLLGIGRRISPKDEDYLTI